jgi:hypothetical protein
MSIGPDAGWEDDPDDPALLAPWTDPAGAAEDQLAADVRQAMEQQACGYAYDLETVARWARLRRKTRPLATADGRGGPGLDSRALADVVLADVAEDFVAELALTRGCTEHEAHTVVREALLLTGPLAPTWCRLNAGLLGVGHARAAVDLLGDAPAPVAAEVQRRVLPRSEGLTATVFRDRMRYHLYRVDAEAKERRRREALRRVDVFARRVDEGVGELVI